MSEHSRRCQAKSKQSGVQCKRWASPGKNVCVIHGSRAGRKSNAERYALAAEKSPKLKENFDLILEENDAFGNIDLTIAGEVTLLRAMLASLVDDENTDPKLKLDMIRDLTRAVQKERELETARENLVPLAKVREMLKLAINTVTRFVPSSSQEECWEELSRAMQPFNETITQDEQAELASLPEVGAYERGPDEE